MAAASVYFPAKARIALRAGTLPPGWGKSHIFPVEGTSPLDAQEPLLPKGRSIPINGDAVRTRRLLAGWSSTEALADRLDMSEKRLAEIEKGGANVYASTLVAIAGALNVPWNELIDHARLPAATPADPPVGNRTLSLVIHFGNINDLDESDIENLINRLKEAVRLSGDASVISVDGGSTQILLAMSEEDTIQLATGYAQGSADGIGILAVKLQGDGALWLLACREYLRYESMIVDENHKGDYADFFARTFGQDGLPVFDYSQVKAAIAEGFGGAIKLPAEMPAPTNITFKLLRFCTKVVFYVLTAKRQVTLWIDEEGGLTIDRGHEA